MKVAVLSREYIPLMYCDIKRAIILVYLNKAEIVRATNQMMHSIKEAFPVPAVIRLLNKVGKHFTPKVTYTRKNVFIRDNYSCQYCGSKENKLTLDHVMPVSRGGTSCWENVVAACQDCNIKKGNKTPKEANMPLFKQPRKPSLLIKLNWDKIFNFDEAWNGWD